MNEYKEGQLHGSVMTLLDFLNLENYNFEYLDESFDNNEKTLELKLEYIGEDIEYKEEEDFKNHLEFNKYKNKYGNIIFEKGYNLKNLIINTIKKFNNDIICLDKIESDYDDYFVVYLYFKLKYW